MINIALIGCGRVSEFHCKAIKKQKKLKLIACCDLDINKAKYLAKKYKAQSFSNYNEMLKNLPQIDIVAIITPSGMHYKHAKSIIIKYKKNLIVEKPICLKTTNLINLFKIAKNKRVKIYPIFQNRYNKAVRRVKLALKNNELGKIRTINVTVRWCRPQRYYDLSTWRGTYSHDGGALSNQGIHYVDILQYLSGGILEVSCIARTLGANIEVEDTALGLFKLKSGGIGSLEVTTSARPDDFEGSLTIVGSKGLAKISGLALNKIEIFSPSPKDIKKFSDNFSDLPDRGRVYGRGHFDTYADIQKDIFTKKKYPIDFDQAYKSINFLNSLYSSYENKSKWIKLNKTIISKKLGRANKRISKLYTTDN